MKQAMMSILTNEIWVDITGYENLYQVSNMGNVRSLRSNIILKSHVDKDGYLRVTLSKNNKKKNFTIHRLVALAFIPNPDNKPTVDHINTIITDNRACNLRWFTQKEQLTENTITRERHRKATSKNGKLTKERRKKKVLCVTTGEIFNSALEASEYYNIKNNAVADAANPKHSRKTAGSLPDGTKLEWEYIN